MVASCLEVGPRESAELTRTRDRILVFADDWGRHPSSCQHLIGHLLDRHDVWWVNTIGLRTPHFDRATLTRGLEKIRQWMRGPAKAGTGPSNPRVLNPRMWPWFSTSLGRSLNRRLLMRALTPVVESLPEPPVVVTTLPIVSELIGVLPAKRWVY